MSYRSEPSPWPTMSRETLGRGGGGSRAQATMQRLVALLADRYADIVARVELPSLVRYPRTSGSSTRRSWWCANRPHPRLSRRSRRTVASRRATKSTSCACTWPDTTGTPSQAGLRTLHERFDATLGPLARLLGRPPSTDARGVRRSGRQSRLSSRASRQSPDTR